MVVDGVIDALSEATGLDASTVKDDVEIPPEVDMGDYAYPCFSLAGRRGESPASIASDIAAGLDDDVFVSVSADGPYVNMVVSAAAKLRAANEVAVTGDETVIVESPSPNTNKPLHLGHALNMVLGQSVANVLEAVGHDVIKENLYNDRGIHISKSMLAYREEGGGETPASTGMKPDHFVGEYYVRFGDLVDDNPWLEDEAQRMLQAWEDGDGEVRALWREMRDWCLDGIKETLRDYGIRVDKDRFESEIYEDGRGIVEDGLGTVFHEDEDGAVVADLSEEGLGEKHVLRADGTTVYLTQDLGLAARRVADCDPDRVIHVVGKEQEYHFDCLFTLLGKLGYRFADSLHHLSYGHVRLPEGAMSSREGTAVHADSVREEMIGRAADEIRERHDVDDDEAERRGEHVGMAALKFFLLRTDPMQDVTFDPDASLSFTGETGPYVQYTHARICSLLDEAGGWEADDLSVLDAVEERRVLRDLVRFDEAVQRAADQLDPSAVANYALGLAQSYNKFYHAHRVLVDDERVRGARLALSDAVSSTLRRCLALLGISAVEAM